MNGITPEVDIIALYFGDTGRVPLLSAEEERDLAQKIQEGLEARSRLARNGHNPREAARLRALIREGLEARNRLVAANLRLVVSIARKYIGTGMPLADLIQEGNLGLLKAAEKFDPSRGRFSTYATWWIEQAIQRALAQQGHALRLPVHAGDDLRRLRRAREHFLQETGREPTEEELADELGMTPEKVHCLLRGAQQAVSLSHPVGEDDDELGDFIALDAPGPSDEVAQRDLREALEDVLNTLEAREARVVRLYFGLEDGQSRTLEEIGEEFNLTRERIRQILREALRALAHPARRRKLQEFLYA